MRRIALLLAALALVAFSPDTFTRRYWSEPQALTRAAPTLVTEGIDISTAMAFTVVIAPAAGGAATISGGQMKLYFRDATVGWYEGDPDTAWSLTGCAGKTTCSKTFEVLQPHGRALAAANGVTVSAGTTLTVRIVATTSAKSYSAP